MRWARYFNTPAKPLGKDGRKISGCVEHIELSKNTAAEGIVLLKNENNLLPLKSKKIVLLGKASEEYVKGGGGSGDVYCKYCTSLYDAFKADGGVEIYEGLHVFYQENLKDQRKKHRDPGMTVEPELSDAQLKAASEFSDTAILSINRYSGEGWDRACNIPGKELHMENIEVDVWGGEDGFRAISKEVFPKGDFYLTAQEEALVAAAEKNFKNVIVLLNVGGIVDTSWFAGRAEWKVQLLPLKFFLEKRIQAENLRILLQDVLKIILQQTPSTILPAVLNIRTTSLSATDTLKQSRVKKTA